MKRIVFIFFPMLFCMQTAFAQDDQDNSISAAVFGGGTIISPAEKKPVGSFTGIELGYQISMAHAAADWVTALNVQDISIAANYINLQKIFFPGMPHSKGILGSVGGIIVHVDMNAGTIGPVQFILSPGLGGEYAAQTYRSDGNPLDGAKFNFAAQLAVGIETPFLFSTKVRLMLEPLHISNGATQSPNAGENMIPFSIGLRKNIAVDGPINHHQLFVITDNSSVELDLGVSKRPLQQTGYYPAATPHYLTDSVRASEGNSTLYQIHAYLGYTYRITPVFSLRVGTDAIYFTHPFVQSKFFTTYEESLTSDSPLALGISAGAGLDLGRLAFTANYGRYVHSDFFDPSVHSYWIFGPKYYATKWLAAGVKIGFHGMDSQYTSIGVMITL